MSFSSPSSKEDEAMAKLHALLTKDTSKSRHLKRAATEARHQKRYYRQATQILQDHERDVAVFPFLALPAEIRLEVYFELLVSDDRLVLTWRGPRKANKQQKRMYISILRTCKLCRDEGRGVLYGENVFDFEEICVRPNIAKPLLSRIGPHNASLIRIVLAEYSAAAEELSQLAPHATHPPITLSFVHTLLSSFNISMAQLRVFAISIIPYGFDQATRDLMKLQAKTIMGMMPLRVKWLDAKNEPEQLEKVIEGICARENGWEKADYYEDVDSKIGLRWASPFSGRLWIKYGAE